MNVEQFTAMLHENGLMKHIGVQCWTVGWAECVLMVLSSGRGGCVLVQGRVCAGAGEGVCWCKGGFVPGDWVECTR